MNKLILSGSWVLERYNRGGFLLIRRRFPNLIMLAQIDDLLDIYFRNGTPAADWNIGLIGGTTVAITSTDSMSSHAGWTEDQNYTEANRPTWTADAPASQKIENSSSVIFTLSAGTTIRGLFLTDENTKGGTTGNLWSAAEIDPPEVASSGQTIRTFYDLTGTGV